MPAITHPAVTVVTRTASTAQAANTYHGGIRPRRRWSHQALLSTTTSRRSELVLMIVTMSSMESA
jgi:hypothetical protein